MNECGLIARFSDGEMEMDVEMGKMKNGSFLAGVYLTFGPEGIAEDSIRIEAKEIPSLINALVEAYNTSMEIMERNDKVVVREIEIDGENTTEVKHPSHYNREGAMECIREMVMLYGIEDTMTFLKLSAHKYRYRSADKGGSSDIEKSDECYRMYGELKKEKEEVI